MASRDEEEVDQNDSNTSQDQVENEVNQHEKEEEEQNEVEEHEVDSSEKNEEESEHNENSKVESDAENDSDEEFAGFGEEEIEGTSKQREDVSDESGDENQEEDDEEERIQQKKARNILSSGDEDEEKNNEDEENNEVNDEETEQVEDDENREEKAQEGGSQEAQSDDDEEFARPRKKQRGDGPSDLELMLMKNKAQKAKNRRRKQGDSEEINDWDNKISAIISEMKNVAAEDRAANEKQIMSLQKQKMLPMVKNMLQKNDLHATMIELGVLGAIAEWLAPLPDRSLPNVSIREFMISTLVDFGEINADYLKSSGIGKAVMFLYKHSKETKENKKKLERLINDWSRPIFNLDGNFKQLSREERLERDLEHVKTMNKKERLNNKNIDDDLLDATQIRKSKKSKAKEAAADEPKKFLRPGDVGFCPRARVPIPSSKDYVIRPKSNVDVMEESSSRKGSKKTETRFDRHKKRFEEIKRSSKSSRAVTMVAAGGK